MKNQEEIKDSFSKAVRVSNQKFIEDLTNFIEKFRDENKIRLSCIRDILVFEKEFPEDFFRVITNSEKNQFESVF